MENVDNLNEKVQIVIMERTYYIYKLIFGKLTLISRIELEQFGRI